MRHCASTSDCTFEYSWLFNFSIGKNTKGGYSGRQLYQINPNHLHTLYGASYLKDRDTRP